MRDKYHVLSPYDIAYMWNLDYGTNEPIYKTDTDSQIQIRLVVAKDGWWEEGWTGNLGLVDANNYI